MSDRSETNRINARKSTGPKTEQGKRRSSQNALKHGIFAKDVFITGENTEQFRAHKASMIRRLNPRDVLELHLVEQIVADTWTIQRARAAERKLFSRAADGEFESTCADFLRFTEHMLSRSNLDKPDDDSPAGLLLRLLGGKTLERLDRYQRRLTGSFHRCLRELRELRKEEYDPATPLTETARRILNDLESDGEPANVQNEANSDASDGEETRCDQTPMDPIERKEDKTSIESSSQPQLQGETKPSEVPRAA